jgi:ABC-2 type transport system ATP-binding protein
MGFIFPTKGVLRVLGEEQVSRVHPLVGYLHERPYVELRLTGKKYLTYMAELSGLWGRQARRRVDETLALVDLSGAGEQKLGSYSKGMLQRIGIAQALLNDPAFLILDEPTAGLDPYSQWKVRQIIGSLRGQGKTLLICSHYLAEVEMLCDTVGILQRGQLIHAGAVQELLRAGSAIEITFQDRAAREVVEQLGLQTYALDLTRNCLKIRAEDQQQILTALVQARVPIQTLNPVTRTLEEVYIQLTRAASQEQKPQPPVSINR